MVEGTKKPAVKKTAVKKATTAKAPAAKSTSVEPAAWPFPVVEAAQKAPAPAKKPAAAKKAPVAAKPVAAKKAPAAAKPAAVKKAPAAAKPAAAKKTPVTAKKAPAKAAAKQTVAQPSAQERYRMVETAAYYIAERSGWKGSSADHWAQAESEIAAKLAS